MSDIRNIRRGYLEGHITDLSCEIDKLKLGLDAIVRIADQASTQDPDEQTDALLQIEALAKVLSEFAEKTSEAMSPDAFLAWASKHEGLNHG